MKRFDLCNRGLALILALALWTTHAPNAQAQVFGTTTLVTEDSNVLNTGTTVLAYDVSNTATSVNGVNFSGATTNGAVTFSLSNFNDSDNNGVDGSYLSSALTDALIDNIFNFGTSTAITLNHLTPGTTYALQVFAGTTGVGFGSMYLEDGSATGTLSFGNGSSNSTAYYTTETFTAGSTGTETLNFVPISDSYNDSFVILDAFNLRAVPEPSTWAMLVGGVVLLLGALRFRSSRA
jgi:hypothetical protein